MLEEHFWGLLSVTLLAALAIRLTALYQLGKTPYFDYLLWDERIYHEWAKQIASGTYQPRAAYEFSPLPAYLIAAVYWLFSPEPVYVRLMNVGLGVLTCLFIALTGRELGRGAAGLAAGAIAALYAPFILYSIVPLKTALSLLLCALVIYLLLLEVKHPKGFRAVVLGICLGLAFNVRGNYALFIPVVLAAAVYTSWKATQRLPHALAAALPLLAGILLAAAPFTVRNYLMSGELVLSTTQSGFNFYIGNNVRNLDPYYRPLPFASSSPFLQGAQFTIEASRRTGTVLTAKGAAGYWYREALREAWNHPQAYAHKFFNKVLAVFNRFEAGDHYDIAFMSGFVPIFRWPLLTFAVIWPAGLAGLLLTLGSNRHALWPALLFVAYGLTLVVSFTACRYRLPLLVMLIPFVYPALQGFIDSLRQHRYWGGKAYMLLVACLTAIAFLPLSAARDRTAYYNTHAIVLNSEASQQEAVRYWELSSQMNGYYSASADLALARVFLTSGDLAKAKACLQKIGDASYAAANKYYLLGELSFLEGNLPQAVAYYRRSLSINSGNIGVRRKLISLLNTVSPQEVAQQRERLTEIQAFYTGL